MISFIKRFRKKDFHHVLTSFCDHCSYINSGTWLLAGLRLRLTCSLCSTTLAHFCSSENKWSASVVFNILWRSSFISHESSATQKVFTPNSPLFPISPLSLHLSVSISLFIQSLPFPRLPHLLVSFSVWCLSLSLDGFVSPGVNQLPDKQLLDEGSPRVFGVTAVSRSAIHLDHCAELQRVDLRKKTVRHDTDCQNRHGGQCFCWKKRKIYICINKKNVFVSQKE